MKLRDLDEREAALVTLSNDRKKSLDIYIGKLQSGDVKENQINGYTATIFRYLLHSVKAHYSLGYPLLDLKEMMTELIVWYEKVNQDEYDPQLTGQFYLDHLTVVSLACLLEVDEKYWNIVVNKWLSFSLKDRIVDFIIKSRTNGHVVNENLIFRKPYSQLRDAINEKDPEASLILLKNYLGKWYVSFKSAAWYNGHNAKGPVYAGYWSFESAAIAKAMALPLNNTKLGQYFPYSFFDLPEQLKIAK